MARLVDADEVYKVLTDYYHHRTEIQHEALKEAIGRVPTIDAVPVVRCKDCRYLSGKDGRVIAEEDYCSKGEKDDSK